IPGIIVAVASHPRTADPLLRTCIAMADAGYVVVFCEPIALYHRRDLASDGDRQWLTMQPLSDRSSTRTSPGVLTPASKSGAVTMWTHGADLAIVTYGNGVPMSVDAARRLLADSRISASVVDVQWLAPLPHADLLGVLRNFDRVLIVDE